MAAGGSILAAPPLRTALKALLDLTDAADANNAALGRPRGGDGRPRLPLSATRR